MVITKKADFAIIMRMLTYIWPTVEKELACWKNQLTHCPQKKLRALALASIEHKRFHAQGGAVFAAYVPHCKHLILPLIIALQTISDYLDNLCDRAGCLDAQAFRYLHNAILDALDPQRKISNYYSAYPYQDDGGYLKQLVEKCRNSLGSLPGYNAAIKEKILSLAVLYNDLQVYKHLDPSKREAFLKKWFGYYHGHYPDLTWWEFAAASGSTLGIFALFSLAASGNASPLTAGKMLAAYFPWICGLHILLDYYIDQDEDRQKGDLNFVSYYPSREQCQKRLKFFLQKALAAASSLPHPRFHLTIVKGLLALYLSDLKIEQQGLKKNALTLIRLTGYDTVLMYYTCRFLRWQGRL